MSVNSNVPRRYVVLGLGAFAIAAGAFGYRAMTGPVAETVLTVERAFEMARDGDIVLVDIRRPDEWERTGIPAYGVPIDMRRSDFAQAVQTASGGKPVALICAHGVRSRRSTYALTQADVGHIIDVPEGMLGSSAGPGWLKAGLPIARLSS